MKKSLYPSLGVVLWAILAIALFAVQADAQGTNVCIGAGCNVGVVNFTSTTANDQDGDLAKRLDNAALCIVKQVPAGPTCSQAQLNAMPNCAAGACGTIYALTGLGTAEYAMKKMTGCYFDMLATKINTAKANAASALIVTNGSTVATNAECTGAVGGLPNGCTYSQIGCRAFSMGANSTCAAAQ